MIPPPAQHGVCGHGKISAAVVCALSGYQFIHSSQHHYYSPSNCGRLTPFTERFPMSSGFLGGFGGLPLLPGPCWILWIMGKVSGERSSSSSRRSLYFIAKPLFHFAPQKWCGWRRRRRTCPPALVHNNPLSCDLYCQSCPSPRRWRPQSAGGLYSIERFFVLCGLCPLLLGCCPRSGV